MATRLDLCLGAFRRLPQISDERRLLKRSQQGAEFQRQQAQATDIRILGHARAGQATCILSDSSLKSLVLFRINRRRKHLRRKQPVTISEAARQFLRSCEIDKNLTQLTLRAYKSDLDQFSAFAAAKGVQQLDHLTGTLIQDFIAALKQIHHYCDSSIRRKIAVLKACIKHLEQADLILQNPLARLRLSFRQEKRLPRVLSRSQIETLLALANQGSSRSNLKSASFGSIRDHALLELLFYSGARIGELLKLETSDVDLNAGIAKIKGKGRRERFVCLGCDPVTNVLKRYLRARAGVPAATEALFLNNRYHRLSIYSAESIVRKFANRAGLSIRVTPHMFRHTMATMLLENGADLRSIQEILGHASISTTEIYTHVSMQKKKQVMSDFHPRQHLDLRRRHG